MLSSKSGAVRNLNNYSSLASIYVYSSVLVFSDPQARADAGGAAGGDGGLASPLGRLCRPAEDPAAQGPQGGQAGRRLLDGLGLGGGHEEDRRREDGQHGQHRRSGQEDVRAGQLRGWRGPRAVGTAGLAQVWLVALSMVGRGICFLEVREARTEK